MADDKQLNGKMGGSMNSTNAGTEQIAGKSPVQSGGFSASETATKTNSANANKKNPAS